MPVTVTQSSQGQDAGINRVVLAWTSDSGGSVDVTFGNLRGQLVGVELVTSSTGRPNENYAALLFDASNRELFGADGIHASPSIPKRFCPALDIGDSAMPYPLNEDMRLVISYAGSVKSGQVILYLKG